MKKARMKRSLALLLAIVMCIGLLPMGALAAQDGQDGIAVDATEDAGLAVQPDGSSEDSEEPNNPSENLDESNSISSEDSEESNDISSEEAEESNSPSEESDSVSSKETEEPAPIDEDGSTVTDAGVWKLSTFGSDAEKEDTGNWLTGSEDGFVLDYGKLYTENDNVGNVVVYDSGAEDLEDSTLEFDYKLEAEADDAKIQFGIFPRFQSGRNCDGLAIGEAAQIQHSYQVNGSEGWPGASNLPNMTFVKDTTYHFKIVTVGNTLTAYVDDTMLTTFTTNSAITNGGYGFRIWGQPNTGNHKKNVTVSNLTRKKCITSTLGSKGVNLKEAEWGSEDVTIPVTFGEGDSVKSISNGTSELTLNTDYAVGANSITIKKEYIEKQADSFTLTVNFTEGSSGEFTVTKLKTSENLELLHYYSFDEKTGASYPDHSGNGNAVAATKNGTVGSANGRNGRALVLEGGGCVQFESSAFAALTSYSVSAWINWDGTLGASNTIFNGRGDWFHVRKQGGNDRKLWYNLWTGNNGYDIGQNSPEVKADEWTHVAFTRDGTNARLYACGNCAGRGSCRFDRLRIPGYDQRRGCPDPSGIYDQGSHQHGWRPTWLAKRLDQRRLSAHGIVFPEVGGTLKILQDILRGAGGSHH